MDRQDGKTWIHHLNKAADGAVVEPEGVECVAVGFGHGICEDLRARRIEVVLEVDVEEGAEIIVVGLALRGSGGDAVLNLGRVYCIAMRW